MTVLSQFLSKLKAKPKTLEEQLSELDQLPVEALLAIVMENESDVLRWAAIASLNYGPELIELAYDKAIGDEQQIVQPGLQQKARQRLAELVDQGAITLDQLAADGIDLMAQFAVVGFCQQDDLLEQLLDSNSDEDFFFQIALEGVSIKSRQLAAEKIEDEERLKFLLKETKGKDKQVYKIVKSKCDGFRDRDHHAAQTQAEIVSLCERLEAHSKKPFDNFFTAHHQRLLEEWALLQTQAQEAIVARVRQATLECQQTIDTFLKQQADVEARELAIANALQQQARVLDKLRGLLAHLFDCVATEEEFESTEVFLKECRQQWLDAIMYKPASKSYEKSFAQLGAGVEFQLQQLQQHGSLIDQLAAVSERQTETHAETETETETEAVISNGDKANVDTQKSNASAYDDLRTRLTTANLLTENLQPQQLLDARSLISEREKQAAEKKRTDKNQLRQLSALVRKAQSATDSGQSRPAAGIRRTIEEKRSALEPLPAYLSRQLEQLDAALEKLLDWKDYVVEPKQQQLIEQMRLLVGSQENPEALATKISRLQNEWKGLSKGAQDQILWETFHQLAQQAYQPCKVFFDQQAKIRSDNLERRVQMVTQLENYLSAQRWNGEETEAEAVDSSAIEKLITTAIKQWRSYTPVERAANKAVQQGFDRVLDALRTKLNEHYQKNADIKRQLIDQVLQLVDRQDNRQAVEEVKRLQAQWKLAGAALRKDEQVLWKSFRKGCDAIFEKRQQQTKEYKAELDVNKNAALALLHEVEGLMELLGTALLDARARVVECQAEYKALGSLPRAKENSLNQAFYKSVEQFNDKVARQLEASKEQVWLDYLTAADKIQRYQIAESDATAAVLEQEARAYMSSVQQWPKNGLAALERKMEQGVGDATQEENEQALRAFCIRAEILCDRPTPEEDRSLRMEFQMSRLKQGLGQKMSDKNVEMNTMVFEWVAVGPVSMVIYQPLLERFLRCRRSF